jgi:hypothetical protein
MTSDEQMRVFSAAGHGESRADYEYRRFVRWCGMLTSKWGYEIPQLADRLATTEAVVLGEDRPTTFAEIHRLWRAAGKLIEGPPAWDLPQEVPPPPPQRPANPQLEARRLAIRRRSAGK